LVTSSLIILLNYKIDFARELSLPMSNRTSSGRCFAENGLDSTGLVGIEKVAIFGRRAFSRFQDADTQQFNPFRP
jgi:hypothetical protein